MAWATRIASAGCGRELPVLPGFNSLIPLEQSSDMLSRFEDLLLQELIASRPVQRLKRIGFLGAVERIWSRNWHSRYAHSLGVARLALLYAWRRDLSVRETRVLAIAGLLHDIGHGPLSHTLEPIFQAQFDVSHHRTGSEIIRGDSLFGKEIRNILAFRGIDVDEVSAMIEGRHPSPHAYLFSSPISLDTIEGITRCHELTRGRKPKLVSADAIVWQLAGSEALPTPTLDSLWRLKHCMYTRFIHCRVSLLYDGLAQAYMAKDIDNFKRIDFLKDERQLRRSKRGLFKVLDTVRRAPDTLRNELSNSELGYEVMAPVRKFACSAAVDLRGPTDLAARYLETKSFFRIPIADLLPERESVTCHFPTRLR